MRGFIDMDGVGWYNGLKRSAERNAKENGCADETGLHGYVDKRARYVIGKIDRDIKPFTRRILNKFDFSEDAEGACKAATIKLRRVLISYFGESDYRKFIKVAVVRIAEDNSIAVEFGYSRDIFDGGHVGKWSLSDAKREFASKD